MCCHLCNSSFIYPYSSRYIQIFLWNGPANWCGLNTLKPCSRCRHNHGVVIFICFGSLRTSGNEFHSTNGAVARLIFSDLRMHTARPDSFTIFIGVCILHVLFHLMLAEKIVARMVITTRGS